MIFNKEITGLIRELGEEQELDIRYKIERNEDDFSEKITIEGVHNFKISLTKHKDVVNKQEYWTKAIWCTKVSFDDQISELGIIRAEDKAKESGLYPSIERKYEIEGDVLCCCTELTTTTEEFSFDFKTVEKIEYEVSNSEMFLRICNKHLRTITFSKY